KRWPTDRFAQLADHLAQAHGMIVLVSGSPAERPIADEICAQCAPTTRTVNLPALGIRLGTLKGIVRRCKLMVTNDTGPRHIAAAFGVPVVTLFGPTDKRWTTIPFKDEIEIDADPTLPEEEVANDHPQRCRVSNIALDDVINAANTLLSGATLR
ncbi:MAG: glycosyltransferase family 9 protein, partial [Phycisphaerales bacterium]|nr:glycosyltransferase family 9 protein [Phycisphaerales bacterium]